MRAPENYIGGETAYLGRCARTFWAANDPYVVAHEIAHTTGLQHVDDTRNLMYPHPEGGIDLTAEQVEQMRHGAWTINHCGRFQGRTENKEK